MDGNKCIAASKSRLVLIMKTKNYKTNLTCSKVFPALQYLQNHTWLGLDSRTGVIAVDDSYWGPRKGYIAHELITSFLFCGPILNLHYVQT
jgi:hypothetical protein